MNIAIDVDGVLANFTGAFVKVLQGVFPEKQIPSDYIPTDWNYTEYLTREEMSTAWKHVAGSKNFWLSLAPLPGADEVESHSDDIHQAGINIIYCTSRSATKGRTVLSQTREWLDHHYLLRDNTTIICVDGHEKKQHIYQLLDVKFAIDDKIETVAECQWVPGLRAVLLDQPWNRSAQELPRVQSVKEFCHLVLGNPKARSLSSLPAHL